MKIYYAVRTGRDGFSLGDHGPAFTKEEEAYRYMHRTSMNAVHGVEVWDSLEDFLRYIGKLDPLVDATHAAMKEEEKDG